MFRQIKVNVGIKKSPNVFVFRVFDKANKSTNFDHDFKENGQKIGVSSYIKYIDYKLNTTIGIKRVRSYKVIYENPKLKMGIREEVNLFSHVVFNHCPSYFTPFSENVDFEHSIILRTLCDKLYNYVGISTEVSGNSIKESCNLPLGVKDVSNLSITLPARVDFKIGVRQLADLHRVIPLTSTFGVGIYDRVRLVGLYVHYEIGVKDKCLLDLDTPTVSLGNNNCIENLYINKDENDNPLHESGEIVILPNGEYHEPVAIEGKPYSGLLKAKCIKG